MGNRGTEGISTPLHHPRGPAQPGSEDPVIVKREEGCRCECILALENPSVFSLRRGEEEGVSLLRCSLLFMGRNKQQLECWRS